MISCAFRYANARREWNVFHWLDKGPLHLEVDGDLPAAYQTIADENRRLKITEGIDESPDYLFDAPVDIAAQEVGFRHDTFSYPWGVPRFRVLAEISGDITSA
jgi:hypothetical protein